MELSDPGTSRAILIGAHSYDVLEDLPAVRNNLAALRAAFVDDSIWGLPPEHCRVVDQPASAATALNALREAGRQATDTLLVYYAGHGLTDPFTDELHLALPGSDPEHPETALRYELVRRAILDPQTRAQRKVVILDCCYSARALVGVMGGAEMATRTLIEGSYLLTASAETRVARSFAGESYTAFTGELITLLTTGLPGGPELLPMDVIYQHLHAELAAKSRPLPQQRNRNTGGQIVIARNRAARRPVEAGPVEATVAPRPVAVAERGAGPVRATATASAKVAVQRAARFTAHRMARAARWLGDSKVARRAGPVVAAATVLAVLAAATPLGDLAWHAVTGPDSRKEALARVPGPVNRDCRIDDVTRVPGATTQLACLAEGTYPVRVALFADRDAAAGAYQRIVRESGAVTSEGDCVTAGTGEHRYPGAGPVRGRVLCHVTGDTATIVWTDDAARALISADVPARDGPALRRQWATWAGTPAFPTEEERALVELLAADGCRRAAVAELDDYPNASVGVTCDPEGVGARAVSYYRFGSRLDLQRAIDDQAAAVKAPVGVRCDEGKAPGFLGTRRYDLRSVEIGVLLCHPGSQSSLVLQWSVEPLLLIGRAVGLDPVDLVNWWRQYSGPPTARVVAAVNAADPRFPSPAEEELLTHVPEVSRVNCLRPSAEQVRKNVGTSDVTAAVVCGPTSGARIIFYYQYQDTVELRRDYELLPVGGTACTSRPPDFEGESPYTRGGATGRLRCSHTNGSRWLQWTDEKRGIMAFAFQGGEPAAMIDWWRNDAGPV